MTFWTPAASRCNRKAGRATAPPRRGRGPSVPAILVVAAAVIVLLPACPSGPDLGCAKDVTSAQCKQQCQQVGTSCSPCVALPDCGWCGTPGAGGRSGACLPATLGEDHRNQRPPECSGDWFYRTADPSVPSGAPFCPAVPVTGPETNGPQPLRTGDAS
jgi:hypothetical protein